MLEENDIITLGLNAYHADSSAAIYLNQQLIVATEEERFTRVKHWAGFPIQSIKFCLEELDIDLNRVNYITIGREPKAKYKTKLIFGLKSLIKDSRYVINRLKNRKKITDLTEVFKTHFGNVTNLEEKICYIEHHLSHLASAFFSSPFKESALLSIDGAGDFTTTMFAYGKKNSINTINSINFPVSLGFLYTAFTQYLGFHNYGDEYKIMGLAPYGEPQYTKAIYKLVKKRANGLWSWNNSYFNTIDVSYVKNQPIATLFFKNEKIFNLLGSPPRKKDQPLTQIHKNIASSVQKVTEDLILHMVNHLKKVTGSENLCLAGGVAQNSVANGKILSNSDFKNLYIPPAGHDAGLSMGSALYHIHANLKLTPSYKVPSPYLGIKFSNNQIKDFLSENCTYNYLYKKDEELFKFVAKEIQNKKVIGWFQGRAEFGPRALGNRSIIADPTNPNAKELINEKIKRRESFRPFAPSILEEYVNDYFETADFIPYMEKVLKIKKSKHKLIPAVTHVDGTGRLQTVNKESSPRYYKLIDEFYKLTNVPILLNTSFNENEPIVNTIEQAFNCFKRTKMDMLVLENFIIEKN